MINEISKRENCHSQFITLSKWRPYFEKCTLGEPQTASLSHPIQYKILDWLSKKLLNLNPEVDLEIFVSYITGILDTETADDDKQESLVGFLAELSEDDVEGHSQEISDKWQKMCGSSHSDTTPQKINSVGIVDQFHSIVEKQQSQKIVTNTISAEEKARKSAILAQYGHLSDGEESYEDEGKGAVADLTKNINTLGVSQREQELREHMKQEHENKKQKDKDDREKQKQKATDRKDTEKKRTQKGEKRR